jgi:hypothetical protein
VNQDLINRYQPGGDIYATLQSQYGTGGADAIATAARSGDETQVNAAIVAAKYGAPLDTSTADILVQQLTTNPLAAPLGVANNILGNTVVSFLKSPWVLGALVVAGFFLLGGKDLLKGWLKKLA